MSQKTLLSFLLTTTMALSLFCQTSDIKTIQSIRSSFQIVRHWEFGISVIYAHTVDNNGVFIICDTTTPNQAKAFFLPAGIKVYDFELGPENVHFCGSENDSLGIVGWFNIPNVLLYSDNVRIAKILGPFPDGAMVKRITKMDYHYMPFVNQYRYAAIGDIVLFRGGSADTLTTILDIGTDYSNWYCRALRDDSPNIRYTDIAVGDSCIVTTGTYLYNNEPCFRVFKRIVNNYLSDELFPTYPSAFFGENLLGGTLVSHINGDKFAIAYGVNARNKTANALSLIDIDISSPSITPVWGVHQNLCDSIEPLYSVRDIRYSPYWQKLYLLHDICGAPFHNLLNEFDLSSGIPSSSLLSWHNQLHLNSVCNKWTGDFSLSSGYDNNHYLILFSKKHFSLTNCMKNTETSDVKFYPVLYDFENPGRIYDIRTIHIDYTPVLFDLDILTLCEE